MKILMDLNRICIGLLCLPILYGLYAYFTQTSIVPPMKPVSLWGEQIGKSKQIQSKTGDASLFIQSSRRNATKNGGFGPNNMDGAIDYHMITRVCICPVGLPCCCGAADGGSATTGDAIYDGGNANMGGFNFDGGNANV
jgi:hypothetical protein